MGRFLFVMLVPDLGARGVNDVFRKLREIEGVDRICDLAMIDQETLEMIMAPPFKQPELPI